MSDISPNNHGKRVACDRCGVARVVRHGSQTGLCRDCHQSLTPVERAAWKITPKPKHVPLKSPTEYNPTPVHSIAQLGAMNLGVRISQNRRAS